VTLVRAVQKLFMAYSKAGDLDRARVYCEALSDLPVDVVSAAIDRLIRTARFLPAVAEIREVVAEARCGLLDADVAWGEVLAQVRRCGRYRIPTWSSPALAAAVDAIGWHEICDSTEQGVTRAHFTKAYRATRARAVESEQLGETVRPGLPPRRLELEDASE